MSQGPVIPSAVDLTVAGNVTQARHELHKAVDFGGDAEQAAWSRKWGEAALAAGEKAAHDAGEWDGWSSPEALTSADNLNDQLIAELANEKPDLGKCRSFAKRIGGKLEDMIEAIEE